MSDTTDEREVRVTVDTADLSKLDMGPRDVLIVRYDAELSAEETAVLQRAVSGTLRGAGVTNLVIAVDRRVELAKLKMSEKIAETLLAQVLEAVDEKIAKLPGQLRDVDDEAIGRAAPSAPWSGFKSG